MKKIPLGTADITLSRMGLGTWAIGGGPAWNGDLDRQICIDTILEAHRCGINLIDTAPGYNFGNSEELDIIQAKYSILDRAMENELLPLCRDNGIVVQVYSPLEQGLLTGTITRDYVPGGARANKVWFQRENMLKVIDMLEQWQPLCARYQCTIPTLALAWILKQSDLISILSGATAPEQVRENVAALNINLSDADATLMREMAEALER
ncbi:TPA: aldo/keto reductase [Escherichia coli]|uniref:aldo/keto reductase n=1 Tax=Escherichia coli TaxID=562 RepID=UPI00075139EC|nr:aldo/keto reductase [Escherichia coli]KUT75056.1 hypothetical protein AWF06_19380 [Escherichia coli]MCY9468918.1 aldo/keto reductase [Escherichia coli]